MSAVVETRIPDEQRDVAPTPEPRLDRRAARRLQQDVLAKMFSEFSHERLLHPAPHGDGWTVADAAGRPSWYFEATRHPLEHWEVDPASVRRIIPGDAGEEPDAQQAVLDLKDVLGLTDEMLPLYLEDLSATMY
ncbi:hypothetical protein K1Y78_52560, partial [Streptomyces sp. tea 10]|nr:hypothetical protein [Streptomyces sp. tea 10]